MGSYPRFPKGKKSLIDKGKDVKAKRDNRKAKRGARGGPSGKNMGKAAAAGAGAVGAAKILL